MGMVMGVIVPHFSPHFSLATSTQNFLITFGGGGGPFSLKFFTMMLWPITTESPWMAYCGIVPLGSSDGRFFNSSSGSVEFDKGLDVALWAACDRGLLID
eukprot:5215758-Karenia_brevis.AAC.1